MLEELQAQYRLSLADKVKAIQTLIRDFDTGKTEVIDSIRLLAHSLHGSGSTFGFARISEAAKVAEDAPVENLLHELQQLLRVLQDTIANTPRTSSLRTILIIEDDADISNLLKVMISAKVEDCQVLIAENASVAGALLDKHVLSLVLLDLVLPDSDGRVLLKAIRKKVDDAVPVLVLSGIATDSVRQECLDLGATSYFTKPFDPELIANTVAAQLSGETAAGESKKTAAAFDGVHRILVAEDDELLVRIIVHRLQREGFEVEHVSTGAATLEALQKQQFSLVILDVKMPILDGFEVLKRIRVELANKDILVIMLTAMGSEKDVVRGYELGANDYIVKPFSPAELLARVKNLLKAD